MAALLGDPLPAPFDGVIATHEESGSAQKIKDNFDAHSAESLENNNRPEKRSSAHLANDSEDCLRP